MRLTFASLAALLLCQSFALAGNTGYTPQPVITSDFVVTNYGPLPYTSSGKEPGGVVVLQGDNMRYVVTTSKITKYNGAGSELWTREYSHSTVHVNGESPYTLYYENWGSGSFQAGSGTDPGEVMGPLSPQKALWVADGIIVVFSDTSRPYRCLVVRFDGEGNLIWRHPTGYPLADLVNGYYTGSGQQRFSTDIFTVSGMLGVAGVAVFESVSYGEMVADGATLPATPISRLTILKWEVPIPGGNGQFLLPPTQFGAQNQKSYGVGAALRYTYLYDNYVVIATQEGPVGSPVAEANKLVFRKVRAPFTSVDDVVIQVDSDRSAEQWNDIAFRYDDDNVYLAGTSLAAEKPRQLAASFTADDFTENWITEIVPDIPVYVSEYPTAPGSCIFLDDAGVTVAGDGIFALGKVDFTGDQLWTVNFPGMEDGSTRRAYAPTMDDEGSIFYTGFESQTEYRIWKVSSEGIYQYQCIPYMTVGGRLFSTTDGASISVFDGEVLASMPHTGSGGYQLTVSSVLDKAVVKGPNEITVEISTGGWVYRANSFTYQATSTSGLPVTLSIVGGTATVAGSKVTFNTAGNVTVRFSQAGNSAFEAAQDVDVQVEVRELATKAHQSISLSSLSTREFSVKPFAVSASASSGLPVSLSVSGPASISGNQITLKGLGTVQLAANQSGNGAYYPADQVSRSFKVRDTTKPSLSQVDKSASTTGNKYSITGEVSDNHEVKRLEYRIKPPAQEFGAFKSLSASTAAGGKKRFSIPVKTPVVGAYTVEIIAVDQSGNESSTTKVTVKKK